ncbi:LOW QUALITY PROTEIN: taste receptor type 2 member 41-like, partial [Notechis scutatus]|uniref:Taste receptor type 2 member 40 n=1 Tax=Notechis scutatus TaxID=8663 RepID=A0A6J1VXR9_9SAUR
SSNCAKIATFTHRYFVLVKLRIAKMVPLFLGGSANITVEDHTGSISYLKFFSIYLIWAILPLLLFMALSTLLIAFLWKHTEQMRQMHHGFKDPRTEAHVAAIKSLISFLIFHVCSFVAD